MFIHDIVKLLLGDIMSDLVHGSDDVSLGDSPRPISVELVEYCLQLVVVQEGFNVQGCNQELSVVYLFVSKVIHFVYYLLNLLVWNVD